MHDRKRREEHEEREHGRPRALIFFSLLGRINIPVSSGLGTRRERFLASVLSRFGLGRLDTRGILLGNLPELLFVRHVSGEVGWRKTRGVVKM